MGLLKRLKKAALWDELEWSNAEMASSMTVEQRTVCREMMEHSSCKMEAAMNLVDNFDAETISKALVIAGYVKPNETEKECEARNNLIVGWAKEVILNHGYGVFSRNGMNTDRTVKIANAILRGNKYLPAVPFMLGMGYLVEVPEKLKPEYDEMMLRLALSKKRVTSRTDKKIECLQEQLIKLTNDECH